jgi:hypothetical protein
MIRSQTHTCPIQKEFHETTILPKVESTSQSKIALWNLLPDPITLLRRFQEVVRRVFHRWQLMLLCPFSHILEIPAPVHRVEIHKWRRRLALRLVPHLPQNAGVDRAHELLAENVETMCFMEVSDAVRGEGEIGEREYSLT